MTGNGLGDWFGDILGAGKTAVETVARIELNEWVRKMNGGNQSLQVDPFGNYVLANSAAAQQQLSQEQAATSFDTLAADYALPLAVAGAGLLVLIIALKR